jgi:hypothetical protein
MFAILEILIIVMMPAIVALMIAAHAWAPTRVKALSFAAVVFMGLLAGLTSSLHFVILNVSREPEFARQSWLPLVLEFKWPSIAYALDILGWDVFFALSMLFAAPVFRGSRLAGLIRWLMLAAGILALAGLSGVGSVTCNCATLASSAMSRYSSSSPRCWACSSTERHPAIRQPMSERLGIAEAINIRVWGQTCRPVRQVCPWRTARSCS